jgi:uncharacterized membrane protein
MEAVDKIPEQIEENLAAVDAVSEKIDEVVDAIPPKVKSILGGDWLGHPLHPALTDLPIGFFTSTFLLDIFGGRRSRRISAAMLGAGLATVAPTLAAGAVEWQKLPEDRKRVGVVHMTANLIASLFYLLSFWNRLRGRRGKGIVLGMLGAGAMTAGGYLGGYLSFPPKDSDDASAPDAQDRMVVV